MTISRVRSRTMPLILKNKTDRIAVQLGARAALRSTSDLVDQLQSQLKAKQRELTELEQLGVESANQFVAVGLKDQRLKALRRAVLGV
jgi:hypothetical protein